MDSNVSMILRKVYTKSIYTKYQTKKATHTQYQLKCTYVYSLIDTIVIQFIDQWPIRIPWNKNKDDCYIIS